MTAEVLPFPMARRVGSIRRIAKRVAYCRTPDSAANTLASHTRRQADVMRSRGFSEHVIAREMVALENAIWSERRAFVIRHQLDRGA
jgi:hypothetical protein